MEISAEAPVNDKEVHTAAYAVFTFLLWQTRWLPTLWLLPLVALIWAGIDESSQAIPIVHRDASWSDYAANVAGIVGVTVVLWAFSKIRPQIDR